MRRASRNKGKGRDAMRYNTKYFVACLILITILFGAGSILWLVVFREKKTPLTLNPDMYTGYYWGDDRYLGRHFYRIEVTEGKHGYWEVQVQGEGWSPYRGYYPNGTLREEGEIYVSYHGSPPEPSPDETRVKWGKYYRPDGTLAAEVKDGTGEQILWYPNGQMRWRQILKDYKRVLYEMWNEEGKLISKEMETGTGPGESKTESDDKEHP